MNHKWRCRLLVQLKKKNWQFVCPICVCCNVACSTLQLPILCFNSNLCFFFSIRCFSPIYIFFSFSVFFQSVFIAMMLNFSAPLFFLHSVFFSNLYFLSSAVFFSNLCFFAMLLAQLFSSPVADNWTRKGRRASSKAFVPGQLSHLSSTLLIFIILIIFLSISIVTMCFCVFVPTLVAHPRICLQLCKNNAYTFISDLQMAALQAIR